MRRDMLDGIAEINKHKKLQSGDLEIDARIAQRWPTACKPAYRAVDLKKEPDHVLDMYGPDARKKGTFAHNRLIARRLAERCSLRTTLSPRMGSAWQLTQSNPQPMQGCGSARRRSG